MTTEIRGIRRKRQTSGTNEKRRNINAEMFSFSFKNYLILYLGFKRNAEK
jgi:hypothetical protein